MTGIPAGQGPWNPPRLSKKQVLSIALAVFLAVTGQILPRFTSPSDPVIDQAAVTPTAAESPDSAELRQLLVQLEEMQANLQSTMGQYGTANPSLNGLVPSPSPAAPEDIPALLAEIEQLYQVMQPLMVQLDVASKSARPASELDAMRAQMDVIHQRLDYLLDRVEAAKKTMPIGYSTIGTAVPISTPAVGAAGTAGLESAKLDQLIQSMLQLQTRLDQVVSQGGFPGSSMPASGGHH